jgi:prevent-host-death family protein
VTTFLETMMATTARVSETKPDVSGLTINLKEAKAGLSSLLDRALKGQFVTITRHKKPVAVIVSVETAELAKRQLQKKRPGLAAHLLKFPGGIDLERNPAPSRDIDL